MGERDLLLRYQLSRAYADEQAEQLRRGAVTLIFCLPSL